MGLVLAPLELRKPSKTGHWEEAVLIDRCEPLLRPLLALKRKAAAQGSALFSFGKGTLTARLRQAAHRLGLDEFNISAYSLRHGGASHDLLCQLRPLQDVKRRGRWAADNSLKRYAKETRLIEVMQRVPVDTIRRASDLQACLAKAIVSHMPANVAAYDV